MATIKQIDKVKNAKIKGQCPIKCEIEEDNTTINAKIRDIPSTVCDIEETDNTIKAVVIKENVDATTTRKGIIRIATDDEASEGISENTAITPHTLKNATENMVDEVIGSELIDVERNGNSITITSKTFIYEQGLASDTWIIVHNLNKRPTVSAVDTAGNLQIPDDVNYDNDNQITVKFVGAFAGYAYLN